MELSSLDTQARPAARGERLAAMLEMVDDTVATVRRIATELRPLMLDDLGLNAAIDWLAHGWAARMGIEVKLQLGRSDPDIGDSAAIALYRMVQEALTNIARHANASEVRIEIRHSRGTLLLTVQDNGVGFAEASMYRDGAHGLMGIRERAYMLGGTLEIGNAPRRRRPHRRAPAAAPGRRRGADTARSRTAHEPGKHRSPPWAAARRRPHHRARGAEAHPRSRGRRVADHRGGQRLPGAGMPAPRRLPHGHRRPVDAGHERAGADQAHQERVPRPGGAGAEHACRGAVRAARLQGRRQRLRHQGQRRRPNWWPRCARWPRAAPTSPPAWPSAWCSSSAAPRSRRATPSCRTASSRCCSASSPASARPRSPRRCTCR